MIIDLGHASAATKGQQSGRFPEFNAVTGKFCSFSFDDSPLGDVFFCPFD